MSTVKGVMQELTSHGAFNQRTSLWFKHCILPRIYPEDSEREGERKSKSQKHTKKILWHLLSVVSPYKLSHVVPHSFIDSTSFLLLLQTSPSPPSPFHPAPTSGLRSACGSHRGTHQWNKVLKRRKKIRISNNLMEATPSVHTDARFL